MLTQQPHGAILLGGTGSGNTLKHGRRIEIQRTTLDPSVPSGARSPEHGGDGGDTAASVFPACGGFPGRFRPTSVTGAAGRGRWRGPGLRLLLLFSE